MQTLQHERCAAKGESVIAYQVQMKVEGGRYDHHDNVFLDSWEPLGFDADTGEPIAHASVKDARRQIDDYLLSQQADLDGGYMEPAHALTESDLRIAETGCLA